MKGVLLKSSISYTSTAILKIVNISQSINITFHYYTRQYFLVHKYFVPEFVVLSIIISLNICQTWQVNEIKIMKNVKKEEMITIFTVLKIQKCKSLPLIEMIAFQNSRSQVIKLFKAITSNSQSYSYLVTRYNMFEVLTDTI